MELFFKDNSNLIVQSLLYILREEQNKWTKGLYTETYIMKKIHFEYLPYNNCLQLNIQTKGINPFKKAKSEL